MWKCKGIFIYKTRSWAATLEWCVPHYGHISLQVRLDFVVENNSKHHQIADEVPDVPIGAFLESAASWAAVQEGRKPALQ